MTSTCHARCHSNGLLIVGSCREVPAAHNDAAIVASQFATIVSNANSLLRAATDPRRPRVAIRAKRSGYDVTRYRYAMNRDGEIARTYMRHMFGIQFFSGLLPGFCFKSTSSCVISFQCAGGIFEGLWLSRRKLCPSFDHFFVVDLSGAVGLEGRR